MQLRKDDMNHVSTRPVALRMIVGAAAVVAALLAFVPAANAARDPISGGTTDLHLKKGFVKKKVKGKARCVKRKKKQQMRR